jgi:hypothetical protein
MCDKHTPRSASELLKEAERRKKKRLVQTTGTNGYLEENTKEEEV